MLNMLAVAPPAEIFAERFIEARFTLVVAALNVAMFCALVLALAGLRRSRATRADALPPELRRSTAAGPAG
jgi:hypothetical protein